MFASIFFCFFFASKVFASPRLANLEIVTPGTNSLKNYYLVLYASTQLQRLLVYLPVNSILNINLLSHILYSEFEDPI